MPSTKRVVFNVRSAPPQGLKIPSRLQQQLSARRFNSRNLMYNVKCAPRHIHAVTRPPAPHHLRPSDFINAFVRENIHQALAAISCELFAFSERNARFGTNTICMDNRLRVNPGSLAGFHLPSSLDCAWIFAFSSKQTPLVCGNSLGAPEVLGMNGRV